MTERDPIDTPLTINQPVNTTSILGRDGVDEDIFEVAVEDDDFEDEATAEPIGNEFGTANVTGTDDPAAQAPTNNH